MNDQPTNIQDAKLTAILENAVDAILTIDENGIVESANPATERLFGYAVEEVIGQNVNLLMPNPFKTEHDQYLKNYIESGIPKIIGIGREVIGRRKDGTQFPLHLAVSEFTVDSKRFFTGVVRDISDLKKIQNELATANQQLENRVRDRTAELQKAQLDLVRNEKLATLGQVSGGIAHEIRNPLNAVKTSAYFLLHAKNPSQEKVLEHLQRIDRQVTLIDNVITALSDVAKLPDANLRAVDIEILLRAVAGAATIPSNIRKVFEFGTSLPKAMLDENQIPIAFRNLIRNARDAMPDGGELTIGAHFEDGYLHAFVADNGVGIPADKLETILEPLYTTKARGMGLGLAITRAVAKRNKCQITIKSSEGKGSRFTIQIPIAPQNDYDDDENN